MDAGVLAYIKSGRRRLIPKLALQELLTERVVTVSKPPEISALVDRVARPHHRLHHAVRPHEWEILAGLASYQDRGFPCALGGLDEKSHQFVIRVAEPPNALIFVDKDVYHPLAIRLTPAGRTTLDDHISTLSLGSASLYTHTTFDYTCPDDSFHTEPAPIKQADKFTGRVCDWCGVNPANCGTRRGEVFCCQPCREKSNGSYWAHVNQGGFTAYNERCQADACERGISNPPAYCGHCAKPASVKQCITTGCVTVIRQNSKVQNVRCTSCRFRRAGLRCTDREDNCKHCVTASQESWHAWSR